MADNRIKLNPALDEVVDKINKNLSTYTKQLPSEVISSTVNELSNRYPSNVNNNSIVAQRYLNSLLGRQIIKNQDLEGKKPVDMYDYFKNKLDRKVPIFEDGKTEGGVYGYTKDQIKIDPSYKNEDLATTLDHEIGHADEKIFRDSMYDKVDLPDNRKSVVANEKLRGLLNSNIEQTYKNPKTGRLVEGIDEYLNLNKLNPNDLLAKNMSTDDIRKNIEMLKNFKLDYAKQHVIPNNTDVERIKNFLSSKDLSPDRIDNTLGAIKEGKVSMSDMVSSIKDSNDFVGLRELTESGHHFPDIPSLSDIKGPDKFKMFETKRLLQELKKNGGFLKSIGPGIGLGAGLSILGGMSPGKALADESINTLIPGGAEGLNENEDKELDDIRYNNMIDKMPTEQKKELDKVNDLIQRLPKIDDLLKKKSLNN
jgi:hypothetical protein